MRDYVNRHPRLQLIQAEGTPPERYQLEYRIRGLRQTADALASVKSHLVEISLPLSYPRMPPQCRMLTPIFHPNIAPQAICIGDHWSPGEPLWSIVARIGEMISFQSYNTKSPLNGEAARWVDQHLDELPLDPVSMMPDDAVTPTEPSTVVRETSAVRRQFVRRNQRRGRSRARARPCPLSRDRRCRPTRRRWVLCRRHPRMNGGLAARGVAQHCGSSPNWLAGRCVVSVAAVCSACRRNE